MMYEDLKDKIVLVTGSSSGIGEATVKAFAQYGAKVVVTGRNRERIYEVAKQCKEASPQKAEPLTFIGDLEKEEYVEKLFRTVINAHGKIDILVNSAGSGQPVSVMDVEFLNELDRCLKTDCRSVMQLCRLCFPSLAENKGSIINVSSCLSTGQVAQFAAHGISKAALDCLTKYLALEFGPKGVRVNAVNPGTIRTPLSDKVGFDSATFYALAAQSTPLQIVGIPGDVANLIVFLASKQASFITGATVAVDGGFNCTRAGASMLELSI